MRKQTSFLLSMFLAVSACYSFELSPRPVTIDMERMRPKGTWEQVTWPDTLDLAERARMAVNAMTGNQEPTKAYCPYAARQFQGNPHAYALEWFHTHDYLQSLPYARTMSGSDQNLEAEANLMRVQLQSLRKDGMIYWPVEADQVKDTSSPQKNGLSVPTMVLTWYERDRNPEWLKVAKLITYGLEKPAIKVENRAYYPVECSIKPDGTWHWTKRGQARVPYTPPDEPYRDDQGCEGAARDPSQIRNPNFEIPNKSEVRIPKFKTKRLDSDLGP